MKELNTWVHSEDLLLGVQLEEAHQKRRKGEDE
jgi:hypothetical protein